MVKLRIVLILGAVALAACPVMAQSLSEQTFQVLDIDETGKIDAMEYGMAMGVAFGHADTNGDGSLSKAEAAVLSIPIQVDADSSGTIGLREFLQAARSSFKAADTDGDGILLP